VGCCLGGCLRLLFFTLWRAILAALIAVVLARVDAYVEERHAENIAGRAWRAYRRRGGTSVRRGTPPDASSAIDTPGRPRP
jgi:protein-S-isoprenylcysteine O-methyltransferase Ste14